MIQYIEKTYIHEKLERVEDKKTLKRVNCILERFQFALCWMAKVIDSSQNRYIISLQGGHNSDGTFIEYIDEIKSFIEDITSAVNNKNPFKEADLIEWKTDLLDDVWYVIFILKD